MTRRDLAAVEDVARYRLLRADQLLQLHWPKASQRRHGESRLRGMFQGQWLDRQPLWDGFGRPRAIYSLGPLGRRYLSLKFGVPAAALGPRPAKENHHDLVFLKHHLATVQMAINLRLAAELANGSANIYRDELDLRSERAKGGSPMPVIPDGFLSLTIGDHRQGFFVELDRATVHLRSWEQRFQAYAKWSPTAACANEFDDPVVLVVVDAPDPVARRRVTDLKELATSSLGAGFSGLFWFAELDKTIPTRVLCDPVWEVIGFREPQCLVRPEET